MTFRLVDIVSGSTRCEKCSKPISHIYILEDERRNKLVVGSECFKQVMGFKAPRARQYIDLKGRVQKNIAKARGLDSIKYLRDKTSRGWNIGLPLLPQNIFEKGESEMPIFHVEEETINELKQKGWREYEEPQPWASPPTRYILINPYITKGIDIESILLKNGWKLFDNPQKRLKLAYYSERKNNG